MKNISPSVSKRFAFGRLRKDKELTDVTLACDDGQQIEAHKIILVASSPFFEKILQMSKHPHPLIYFRGFQSKHVEQILDFIYFGETGVDREDLNSFLEVAEQFRLDSLTGQGSKDPLEEQEKSKNQNQSKSRLLTEKT